MELRCKLHTQGISPPVEKALYTNRIDGPRAGLDPSGEDKSLLLLSVIEPRLVSCPASSVVTMPITLPWLTITKRYLKVIF
jgi:hypothetical protein